MTTVEQFSNRLVELRQRKQKRRQEVADDLNITRASLEYYEKGKRKPDIEILVRIADYYEVSCDYLLRGVTSDNLHIYRATGLSQNAIEELKDIKQMADKGYIGNTLRFAEDDLCSADKSVLSSVKKSNSEILKYLSLLIAEPVFGLAVEEVGSFVDSMYGYYTDKQQVELREKADFALYRMNKCMVEAAENILSNKEGD